MVHVVVDVQRVQAVVVQQVQLLRQLLRQGTFTQRVVNAWNGLPGKVMAAETVDKLKLELDRFLEVMEIEGDRDVGRTFW